MRKLLNYQKNESGFTLVELLVVILIIGVLAAIAIPVFLNQQKAAVDTRTVSDMKTAQIAINTWIVNNPNATGFGDQTRVDSIVNSQKYSDSTDMYLYGKPNDWCLRAFSPSGKQYDSGLNYVVYKSLTGQMGSVNKYGAVSYSTCYNDPATRYSLMLTQ